MLRYIYPRRIHSLISPYKQYSFPIFLDEYILKKIREKLFDSCRKPSSWLLSGINKYAPLFIYALGRDHTLITLQERGFPILETPQK